MATRDYCSNVGEELSLWSSKLHMLSSEIDRIPSIDKHKLLPQIEQFHIIMTELDDRLCEMANSCSLADEVNSGDSVPKASFGVDFNKNSSELFDYDVGG